MTSLKEICPNYKACKIIVDLSFELEHNARTNYMKSYCENGEMAWSSCKRYLVKETWHICPDFVLPDTTHSPDEILDMLEEGMKN